MIGLRKFSRKIGLDFSGHNYVHQNALVIIKSFTEGRMDMKLQSEIARVVVLRRIARTLSYVN